MKNLSTPENYRQNQSTQDNLINNYDYRFPERSTFYDRALIGFQFSKRTEEKIEYPYISLNVLGKTYSIPSAFSDLVEEITESKYILDLENDWDGFSSISIHKELYKAAIEFLLLYFTYIYEKHKVVITSPEINPCSSGTIDFSWKTEKARMLVNVSEKKDGYKASFYCFLYDNKLPKEGLIDMLQVEREMALWMVNLK